MVKSSMLNFTTGLMFKTFFIVMNKQNETGIPIEESASVESQQCYGIYGCFSIAHPWVTEHRPIALYPFTPEALNVRYPVFTRHNMKTPMILDPNKPENIKMAKLNPKGPFYFICHGYLDGGDKQWIQTMTEALLSLDSNSDASVIAVDWRGGSSPPYSQAVANTRLVGTITAFLINDIYETLNLKNLDNFHFIGHSLGAHSGGYTGYTLQKKFGLTLGRITGMDPAEPHFGKASNLVRLDRTDAKYVDIIHTDASPFISGGLGISDTIGHVDFFPNGGSSQPGCNQGMIQYFNTKDISIMKGLKKFLGCNHLRSYEFFTESIAPSCPFLSITCPSYQDFLNGACLHCGVSGHHCLPFGFHSFRGYKRLLDSGVASPSRPIKAYLMTNEMEPFCRVHYRMTVNISASLESSSHGGDVGRLWIVFINKDGVHSDKIPLEEQAGHHKPGTQRTLMVAARDIGVPVSAMVEWEYETNLLNPLTWRILMSPRVYIAWVHIDSLEHKMGLTICPPNESPVMVNTPSHFQPQNCKNLGPIKISTASRYMNPLQINPI